MLGLLGVFFTLLLGLAIVYCGLSLRWSFAVTLIWFVFTGLLGLFAWGVVVVLMTLTLVLMLLLQMDLLRRRYFSRPLMQWFQRQLPTLSEGEQVVLQAGGLWWEHVLFTGQPDWSQLATLPYQRLTAAEQAFLDHEVNTLCAMLNDWEIVHQYQDLPPEVWAYLKSHRFFALGMDSSDGGLGFSALAQSAIITRIAARSYSAAITVMVPNSVGPAELVRHYGTPTQRDYYLPRLACGEEIPCFALTGLNAGSDATGMTDRGEVCRGEYQGQVCLGVRLNWNKRYITLAPVATLMALAFKLYDPDHLLGEQTDLGISLALVPMHLDGVERGKRHCPLGLGFMNGPTQGKNVFISLDHLIGGIKRCGQGWQMMMACLAVGRGISLPALASAAGQVSSRMTGAYVRLRRQFQRPIGEFEGVQAALARIGGLTLLINSVREFTAQAVANRTRPAVASAMAKYHLTEMSRQVINDAMDIHAGWAVQCGPANYLAHFYMSAPINITVEGANILTRSLIIFGQGVMRCHPYLAKEIMACRLSRAHPQNNSEHLERFDRYIRQHVGWWLRSAVRTLIDGLTGGRWVRVQTPPALVPYRRWLKQLTRLSQALVVVSDLTLAVIGREFKQREALSARLGDVLSHLYLASAVLYQCVHQPPQDATTRAAEKPMVAWALTYCLAACQQAFDAFFDNVRGTPLSGLKRLIFPYGRCYRPPDDALQREVATQLQTDNPARDRLTASCYMPGDANDPSCQMEQAWQQLIACQPILAQLPRSIVEQLLDDDTLTEDAQHALIQGKLSDVEAEQLIQMIQCCRSALQVDSS